MASRFSNGDYVAQIFAYESDVMRLLQNVQLHVAGGNALYGATFLCRYSGNPSAIEKRNMAAASSRRANLDHEHDHDLNTNATPSAASLTGDLTLTLLHIDTKWRFDQFESRIASPKLSWPAIRKFFVPGIFMEGDLILKDQYCHPNASRVPPPSANLLHIEIKCIADLDSSLQKIAARLRTDIPFWTRQLLFESDPAQAELPRETNKYVLIMEADARHTAETLVSRLDTVMLRKLAGEHVASALVRVFSLEGSATYHDMTPQDVDELPIDNRTYDEVMSDSSPTPEPTYFGLSPSSYVHL